MVVGAYGDREAADVRAVIATEALAACDPDPHPT